MNPLTGQLLELVEKVRSKFDELADVVTGFLDRVPWGLGWLADQISHAWSFLTAKIHEFWGACDRILGNLGSTEAIGAASTAWSAAVGGPVSAEAGNADHGILESDEHWTGTAAEAYRARTELQRSALLAVESTYADGAIAALDTVRNGLTMFYVGLITALGALAAGIITALVTSSTVFGIPAGIFVAAGAVLLAEGAFYTAGILLRSDCETARTNLLARYHDSSAFPGGSWPGGAVV